MAKSSTSKRSGKAGNRSTRKKRQQYKGDWKPPYDGFPLSHHPPSDRLYKGIRGKRYYFGNASDWQAAVDKYDEQRDYIQRHGRRPPTDGKGVDVDFLANSFLEHKENRVKSGELTQRTWDDYKRTSQRLIRVLGRKSKVGALAADDFEKLRSDMAKSLGPVALKNEIVRTRCIFNYGLKNELYERSPRYGSAFDPPKAKTVRKALNRHGERMFEPAELRALIDAAPLQLRAMILLAANGGMGNQDLGCLPLSAVNLETGWVDFPREKTGTPRRFPLWPETQDAIKAWLAKRPEPKPEAEGLLFVTRKRNSWAKESTGGALTREFRKLMEDAGTQRAGLGFYCLRRTFQTVGEEAGETATQFIMGHVPPGADMSSVYRQRIADQRLTAVTEHVREWLYADAPDDGKAGKKSRKKQSRRSKGRDDSQRPRLRVVG